MPTIKIAAAMLVLLVMIGIILAIVGIIITSTDEQNEEIKGRINIYGQIQNVVQLMEPPKASVSCTTGLNQYVYKVDLNEMQVRFQGEEELDVYVSVIFKGARKRTNPDLGISLKPSITQGIGGAGQLKFNEIKSSAPPPINRIDISSYTGPIKLLQPLFINNHIIKLTSLEDKRNFGGPDIFTTSCVASVNVKCSVGNEYPFRLTVGDTPCTELRDRETCSRSTSACGKDVEVILNKFQKPGETCAQKDPLFTIIAEKSSDWEIGEELSIVFWESTSDSQDCWEKSITSNFNNCKDYLLGGYEINIPIEDFGTCID
jgi:hypothetical protein